MVDLSLRLHHHLHDPKNYAALAAVFLSIFTQDSPMRRRIDDIAQEIGEMRLDVRNLRADVRTVAVAVDQHMQRLHEIEKGKHPPVPV